MSVVKTLVIDGQDVSAREDQTILDVARENNIFIPALCHIPGLHPVGACRLCVVEVKGSRKLLPACTTTVEEGMEVTTASGRLAGYRRTVLELLFSERNHICSVCVSNGNCELQSLAKKLEITHIRFPYLYPKLSVDASRVCDEIEGAHTWDVMGRGIQCRVITDLNQRWGDSETCTACGKCVQVCPTGALSEKGKSVAEMSKRRGFLPYLTMMRERAR